MGLFSGIKKQLLKVIEWEDQSRNTLVHKFICDDRYAIMKGSQLIVRPSQAAIFVYQGSICDVFTEGIWKLEEGSTPILTKLANWKYAFENPKLVDVYFVNLRQFTQMKWGTPNPIMMRDKDFGMIRISGHGEYSFHVMKPDLFMRECFGTIHSFKTEDIQEHLRSIVLAELTDLMGECQIPALDLAANYLELGDTARNHAAARFQALGLDIDQILIRNLKLPEAVEQAMDKRTTLGVFSGAMDQYAQYEAVGAMRDAAKNGNGAAGSFVNMGMGLTAGAAIGQQFAGGLNDAMTPQAKCPKCGASVKKGVKFCPECGAKIEQESEKVACPKCGQPVDPNAKFCPHCGEPMKKTCPKCGQAVNGGVKFCPNCGEKLS